MRMRRVTISPHHFRALALLVAAALAAGLLAALVQPKPAEAAFPKKNGEIAFQSNRDGNEEIYVTNTNATNQTRLTTDPNNDLHPAFSPDGKQLTFTSRRPNNVSDEIYVMNADGTNQTPRTGHPPRNFQSVFSPDGQKIAFVSFRDGTGNNNSEIYTMNADGTNQTRLTNTAENETRPVFSPDGKKIAFTRRELSGARNVDIYLMNSDGTGQTRLTTDPAQDNNANFSPDGKKIAFNRSGDIYLMNSDGTDQTRLTTTSYTEELPAFSPDNEQLAFASDQDGNFEIYVMSSSGAGTPTRLTETAPPVVNTKPDWGPDTAGPTFSGVPGSLTQEASGPSGAKVTYDKPTATDRVDGSVTVECSPASGSTFEIGTTKVTCTAKDKAGNEATTSFYVTVQDTTAPTISGISNIEVAATAPSGAEVTYFPTASDLVDGDQTVECSPASGSTLEIGATTVTCMASDTRGNEASESFTVTVKGAGEQLSDLVATVQSLDIHQGTKNSLLTTLHSAQQQLDANDQEGACEDLKAFTNHLRAQYGKKLTTEQANSLTEEANRIREVLGC